MTATGQEERWGIRIKRKKSKQQEEITKKGGKKQSGRLQRRHEKTTQENLAISHASLVAKVAKSKRHLSHHDSQCDRKKWRHFGPEQQRKGTYWATCSFVCSFAALLICWLHTACFALALCCIHSSTHSLTHALTHSQAHGKEVFVNEMNTSISYNFKPLCNVTEKVAGKLSHLFFPAPTYPHQFWF